MFVPFISERSKDNLKKLYRRKGGGGGGKGGGGGGGKSSGGGSSSSGGGRSSSVSSGGTSRSSSAYGPGGGAISTIPGGAIFAGRNQGGGTRGQIYGTSAYGSGYPNTVGRGVANRGFPFYFWPLAFGGVGGVAGGAYLHNSEYGRPDNSSRPGGVLVTASFYSTQTNTTFRILSDNSTVTELIQDIQSNCTSSNLASNSSSSPSTYQDSFSALPQPEQTIQYYRASSIALSLDGYNNTAALSSDENAPDTPLPNNIDKTLLTCLNETIGAAAPLISGGSALQPVLGLPTLLLVYLVYMVGGMV